MKAIKYDTLKIRLDAVRESQKRTRLALFVSMVVSLSVVIVYWNTHLSWYKRSSFDEQFSTKEVQKKLEEESLASSQRSHWITIQWLGITVGADDIPTIGSLSLLIITAWLYSCVKRDNQTIGLMLVDYKDRSQPVRSFVIHGISSHLLLTLREELEPVRDLERPPKISGVNLLALLINKIPFCVPAIAMGFVLIMEVVSTFWLQSVYTEGNSTIFDYWMSHGAYHSRMYQYLGYISICLTFTIVIVVIILRINYLHENTLNVLERFIRLPEDAVN
jgi:hypothetical protein